MNGSVLFYGKVVNEEKAKGYYETLLNTIEWKNDEAIIYGKHYITKRKVAWYGEKNIS